VSLIPDGRRAVSASYDKTLRVWDLETGRCLRVMEGHTHFDNCVSVTPDGLRAVSGSRDGALRVWDLETGRCLRVLEGHTASVGSVSVTPDGLRAVSESSDNTLRAWDLETGTCLIIALTQASRAVAISPTPGRFIAGTVTGEVLQYDLRGFGLDWVEVYKDPQQDPEIHLRREIAACIQYWGESHHNTLLGKLGLAAVLDQTGSSSEADDIRQDVANTCLTLDGEALAAAEDVVYSLISYLEGTEGSDVLSKLVAKFEGPELERRFFHIAYNIILDYQEQKRKWQTLSSWNRIRTPEPKAPTKFSSLFGNKEGLQEWLRHMASYDCGDGTRDLDTAIELYKAQEQICRELGNKNALQTSLENQANILYSRGDLNGAMALYKEQEDICRHIEYKEGLQTSLFNQALILKNRDDLDGAMLLYKEQEGICRELGNKDGLQRTLGNQALILQNRGDLGDAITLLEEQEGICRELGNKQELATALFNQALFMLKSRGNNQQAAAKAAESIEIYTDLKMDAEVTSAQSLQLQLRMGSGTLGRMAMLIMPALLTVIVGASGIALGLWKPWLWIMGGPLVILSAFCFVLQLSPRLTSAVISRLRSFVTDR
jgi:tetratricopeptide (TPR) repeat protein